MRFAVSKKRLATTGRKAMFEDSLVESSGRLKTERKWTTVLSFILQCLPICAASEIVPQASPSQPGVVSPICSPLASPKILSPLKSWWRREELNLRHADYEISSGSRP